MGRKCLDESGRQVQVNMRLAPALKKHFDENGKSKYVSRLISEDKKRSENA